MSWSRCTLPGLVFFDMYISLEWNRIDCVLQKAVTNKVRKALYRIRDSNVVATAFSFLIQFKESLGEQFSRIGGGCLSWEANWERLWAKMTTA